MREQPAIAVVASLTFVELVVGFVVLEPLVLDLMVSWVGSMAAGPLSTMVTVVVCWVPIGLLDGYRDVILLTMVRERQQTGDATVRGGIRAANGRIRIVAECAGISVLNLAVLGMLRLVPGTRVLRWTGNVAWELVTFFVMPVIAFEDDGTPETLRRSAALIRRHAKAVASPAAGMLLACLPAFLPSVVLLELAYVTPVLSQPPGAPYPPPDAALLTLGMVAAVPGAILLGTSTLLLRYALYERVTGGQAPGAYAARDLEAAMPSLARAC